MLAITGAKVFDGRNVAAAGTEVLVEGNRIT